MTSVASGSPEFSDSSKDYRNDYGDTADKEMAPQRPRLVSPPRRPQKPPEPEPAPVSQPLSSSPPATPEAEEAATQEPSSHLQPITPPSEPRQYRAIGTVRGTYTPDEEDQFNRGQLMTSDGQQIEAVLLGRITSLVRNHIDLSLSHLWVVYPRTRQSEQDGSPELHLQIVGVWEPETLGLPGEEAGPDAAKAEAAEDSSSAQAEPVDHAQSAADARQTEIPDVDDNYFSIRGEILKYEEDEQLISVKILQNPRKGTTTRKAFRLTVKGALSGRTVGYFWNLDVRREGSVLVLEQGNPIGIVPPQKKRAKGGGRGGPRRGSTDRRPSGSNRPRPRRSEGDQEISKVVIKRSDRDASQRP